MAHRFNRQKREQTETQTEGQTMKTPLFLLTTTVILTAIAIVGGIAIELLFWLW